MQSLRDSFPGYTFIYKKCRDIKQFYFLILLFLFRHSAFFSDCFPPVVLLPHCLFYPEKTVMRIKFSFIIQHCLRIIRIQGEYLKTFLKQFMCPRPFNRKHSLILIAITMQFRHSHHAIREKLDFFLYIPADFCGGTKIWNRLCLRQFSDKFLRFLCIVKLIRIIDQQISLAKKCPFLFYPVYQYFCLLHGRQ